MFNYFLSVKHNPMAKGQFIGFRLSGEDHRLFLAAARIANKSITQWVNEALREIAAKQVFTTSASSRRDTDD